MKFDFKMSDKELLYFYRLKSLTRYNDRTKVCNEDVAQHSFYVSLFCLKIMEVLDLSDEMKFNILTKAILHDAPEIETGDISYTMKQKNPKLKTILAETEEKFYKEHFESHLPILKNGNAFEDSVVKLADVLSVKQYCINEISLGNSILEFLEMTKQVEQRIESCIKKVICELERNEGNAKE